FLIFSIAEQSCEWPIRYAWRGAGGKVPAPLIRGELRVGSPAHAHPAALAELTEGGRTPWAGEAGSATEHRPEALRPGSVDEVGDVLPDVAQELVGLSLRELAVLDGLVEVALGVGHQRVDEPVDGLLLILGDVRERLAALELRQKLGLTEAEVVGRRAQATHVAHRARTAHRAKT